MRSEPIELYGYLHPVGPEAAAALRALLGPWGLLGEDAAPVRAARAQRAAKARAARLRSAEDGENRTGGGAGNGLGGGTASRMGSGTGKGTDSDMGSATGSRTGNGEDSRVEHHGDLLRLNVQGVAFPLDEAVEILRPFLCPQSEGRLDLIDREAWTLTRVRFSGLDDSRSTVDLNHVLDFAGH